MSQEKEVEVIIEVEETQFRVEKRLLTEKSSYFDAMFSGNYKESSENKISIQIVSATAFEYILSYFKSNLVTMPDSDKIPEIMCAINYFRLDELQKRIVKKLISSISNENCFHLFHIAKEHELSDLENVLKPYILYSFHDLVEHINVIKDLKTLHWYLAHEKLNAKNEYDVFSAGLKWLKQHGVEESIQVILSCVLFKKLNRISLEKLKKDCLEIGNENLMDGLFYSLDERSHTQNIDAETRKKVEQILSPRRCRSPIVKPHVVQLTKGEYRIAEYLTDEKRLSESFARPDSMWWGQNILSWKGFNVITLCGKSKNHNIWNHEIRVFNCLTNQWTVLPTFVRTGRRHALALVDDKEDTIYLLGGWGTFRYVLNSAQCYNIKTNEWKDLPDLPERCNNYCGAFHKGRLYVCGEIMYVLQDGQWVFVLKVLATLFGSMFSHGERLYFGGRLDNCTIYSVDMEGESKVFCKDIKTHYNIVNTCVIGDTVYIFTSGENFEDIIGIETFSFSEFIDGANPEKTDLIWVDKNCEDKFYNVSCCFTLSVLSVNDDLVNDCGEEWL